MGILELYCLSGALVPHLHEDRLDLQLQDAGRNLSQRPAPEHEEGAGSLEPVPSPVPQARRNCDRGGDLRRGVPRPGCPWHRSTSPRKPCS